MKETTSNLIKKIVRQKTPKGCWRNPITNILYKFYKKPNGNGGLKKVKEL